MLYKITPTISINPEKVVALKIDDRTDSYSEPHVTILFEDRILELSPAFEMDEIRAAINGGCYYRKQYTDECGDIDVCVVHNEISESEETWDPLRFCRKRDPKFLVRALSKDEGWVGNDDPKPEPPEDMRRDPYEPKLGPIARLLAGGNHD